MLKSHNKMKYVILISFLLLFIQCKGQNSSEEVRTSKNDTIILSSGIYVLTPNDKEIRDLKLKHGDENFYVIADDANYYMAEISGLSKIKITYPRFSKLVFKEEGFILDKSKYDNNWLVIDYHKGDKPKIYSLLDYYLSLNEKSKSKESTSTKSIKTEGSSLVVNNKYFDDLIVNAMSLTTNLEIIDETQFYLIYEYSASATKMKQVYNFNCVNSKVYLLSKEILKYGLQGASFNKIYLKNYILDDKKLSDLEDIGSSIPSNFLPAKSLAYTQLLDNDFHKLGIIKYNRTNEERFMNYNLNNTDNIKQFYIENMDKLNNTAYYFEQSKNYKESIFLLKEIIKKEPNRVVAWLNIADAYWGNNQKKEAKEAYQKYISLMKSQKKDLKKIPQRAQERSK